MLIHTVQMACVLSLGTSVLEVIKAFEKASGKSVPYKLCDRRAGDVPSSYATCELASKELGWRAKLTIHDMCMYK